MKLKLDENGHVVVQEGKPVYVYDDGKEVAYDVPQAVSKITALNAEAKKYREEKEAVETKLKAFEGIDDVNAAKKALETVKHLDDKKLMDAGEVEKVKAEMAKSYEEKLAQANSQVEQMQSQLYQEVIGGAFARSKIIADKTTLPTDVAQAFFGKNFSYEDGKIVAKDSAGNPIYSRSKPGELADFDEAMETLINTYPNKENILRGSGSSGGGANANPNAPGANSGLPNSLKECKTDAERVAYMQAKSQTPAS